MPKIFISFRRDDSLPDTERIWKWLAARYGKRSVFMDRTGIDAATDFRKSIVLAIEKCSVFLCVIGPKWLNCVNKEGRRRLDDPEDYVRTEIDAALIRDIVILPVLVGGSSMPAPDELPPSLRNLAFQNALQVRDEPHLDEDMRRLKAAIDRIAKKTRTMAIWPILAGVLIAGLLGGWFAAVYLLRPRPIDQWALVEQAGPDLGEKSGSPYYRFQRGEITFSPKDKDGGPSAPMSFGRKPVKAIDQTYNLISIGALNPVNGAQSKDWPVVIWDIPGNARTRLANFKPDRGGTPWGTTLIASPGFRAKVDEASRPVPAVDKAAVNVIDNSSVRVALRGHYGSSAIMRSMRTYPPPEGDKTTARISVEFLAEEDIELDADLLKSDAFRFFTLESTFDNNRIYDCNVIKFNNTSLSLNDNQKRDDYIFDYTPERRQIGSWLELVKEPGSNWNSGSPSIRVNIGDLVINGSRILGGKGHLAIQGYLYKNKKVADRSITLEVWVEWLDAPSTIEAGTTLGLDFTITATRS